MKRKKSFSPVFAVFLSLTLYGLASKNLYAQTQLLMTHDAEMVNATSLQKINDFEAGSTYQLTGQVPLLIRKKGHIPVYLIPKDLENTDVKISLPEVKDWPNSEMQQALSGALSKSLSQIQTIRQMLQAGQNDKALELADSLVSQFPEVTFLRLVRASTFFVNGKRDAAKSDLVIALKEFPEDPEARELAAELGMATPSATQEPTAEQEGEL